MMIDIQKHGFYTIRSFILMIVLYTALSLLCGVFGIFYANYIWILWLSICIFLYVKKVIIFSRPSLEFRFYILIALSFSLLIAFFTVPTIFSGRDQGSITEAAMQLSQSHTLITHSPESTAFFEIYGHGKALNFPGFFYTADGGTLTQFPLPYITYLSGFFGIFGVSGLIIANSVLLFVFILSITCIARTYLSVKYTSMFLLLLLSSFAIGWFAKFTLSENLASVLLWCSTLLYIMLKKEITKTTFFTLFISLSLLLFSRIEGMWFFAIFTFLILRNESVRTFLKKDVWWHIIFPLVTLFTISCVVAVMNIPFIHTMLGVFIGTASSGASTHNVLEKISYLFSVYAIYGLLGPLLITAIMSILAIRYKKYRFALLPIAIILPLFSYYLFPHISGDHPWMLRRFVFALLPATILMSTFFISIIPQKNLYYKFFGYTIFLILFFTNIPALSSFITYAENTTLQKQVHEFSQHFSQNDLILIDKNVAGNGWSMITNPLRSLDKKSAVYFFNPADYHKLNTEKFDHVYLVTSNENKNHYMKEISQNMHYANKYIFTVNQLQLEKSKDIPQFFPQKKDFVVRGTIYELKK